MKFEDDLVFMFLDIGNDLLNAFPHSKFISTGAIFGIQKLFSGYKMLVFGIQKKRLLTKIEKHCKNLKNTKNQKKEEEKKK